MFSLTGFTRLPLHEYHEFAEYCFCFSLADEAGNVRSGHDIPAAACPVIMQPEIDVEVRVQLEQDRRKQLSAINPKLTEGFIAIILLYELPMTCKS